MFGVIPVTFLFGTLAVMALSKFLHERGNITHAEEIKLINITMWVGATGFALSFLLYLRTLDDPSAVFQGSDLVWLLLFGLLVHWFVRRWRAGGR